jgi:hypothetical protein
MYNDNIDFVNNKKKSVSSNILKKCFINSLNLIENDNQCAWKYKSLTFYEFLNAIQNVGYEMFSKNKTKIKIDKFIYNMILKICRT